MAHEALSFALEGGTVFGTPIVHYKPTPLAPDALASYGEAQTEGPDDDCHSS